MWQAAPKFLLAAVLLHPENPIEFVKRLIVENNAGHLHSASAKLLSGEATALPDSLGKLKVDVDALLPISPTQAVARVQPALGSPAPKDIYLFLNMDGKRWQMTAVRLLSLGGVPSSAYEQLKRVPTRTPEEEAMFQNLKLTLSTDAELVKYFKANKWELERLAREAVPVGKHPSHRLEGLLKASHVIASQRDDGIVRVTVGGMLDNEVGFMKVLKGKPPKMSPDDYIWIQAVDVGWYLYKTT